MIRHTERHRSSAIAGGSVPEIPEGGSPVASIPVGVVASSVITCSVDTEVVN